MDALPPLLVVVIFAAGTYANTPPRPYAGTPAPTAQAKRPRRYVGRHAANRKRATR